jgi:hypothetical protein
VGSFFGLLNVKHGERNLEKTKKTGRQANLRLSAFHCSFSL